MRQTCNCAPGATATPIVINGEKTSVTFSDTADAYLLFARTGGPDEGARGVSALFVPADTPGIKSTRFDDVGSCALGRGSVFFDDVRVPASHRVGDEGKGFTQVMQGFDYSRALIALQCVGAAQASLDEAWAYAKEREAFGRPIGQFQGVSFPLAEGDSHIAAVRQLSLSRARAARRRACRTPLKRRWSSGWGRGRHSTSSTSAC